MTTRNETVNYVLFVISAISLYLSPRSDLLAFEGSAKGLPVHWSAGDSKTEGFLNFNPAEKRLTLTTTDGKPVELNKKTILLMNQENPLRKGILVAPARGVAVLGFSERLTGIVRSKVTGDKIEWALPGLEKPVNWPASAAVAWVFHPNLTVAAYEDFENSNEMKIVQVKDAPVGLGVLQIDTSWLLKLRKIGRQDDEQRLFQFAFFEPSKTNRARVFQIDLKTDPNTDLTPFLELKYDDIHERWSASFKADDSGSQTPLARTGGWHIFSILAGKERLRACIDDAVVLESRRMANSLANTTEIRINADSGDPLLIDAAGFYQFNEISAPVDRPLNEDLIQLDGGHEIHASSNQELIEIPVARSFLPKQAPGVTGWAFGPVARVVFRHSGETIWNALDDSDYLRRLGLVSSLPRGCDAVEGAIVHMDSKSLAITLPQGGTIRLVAEQVESIQPLGYTGLRILEARPHHLGDEIDLKVIPPQPEGNKLTIRFDANEADARQPAELAVDVLQALGAKVAPFIDSIARGELITEIWLGGKNLGTLNSRVMDRNETPQRIYFELPSGALKAGSNELEFRQKGQKNDPNYLDDLSILGVRLYRKS